MALPSTNLWVHQVANELGESSNDIGRLCKSSKINPWSKFKPVRFNSPVHNDFWWIGSNGYCGFSHPKLNLQTIEKSVYEQPRGIENEPFRLHDFKNYDHNAIPPFDSEIPVEIDRNSTATYFRLNIKTNLSSTNLTFIDFAGFADSLFYFGVSLIQGGFSRFKTAQNNIGVSTLHDYVYADFKNDPDLSVFGNGTIRVAYFVCRQAIPFWSSGTEQDLFTLHNDFVVCDKTIQVISSQQEVTTYLLDVNIGSDTNCISLGVTGFNIVNNTMFATGTVSSLLSRSWTMDSIKVTVRKKSDNSLVHEMTYDHNPQLDDPYELNQSELMQGTEITFIASLDNRLQNLVIGESYTIRALINYI